MFPVTENATDARGGTVTVADWSYNGRDNREAMRKVAIRAARIPGPVSTRSRRHVGCSHSEPHITFTVSPQEV